MEKFETIGMDKVVLSAQIIKINIEKLKSNKKGISINRNDSSEFYGIQFMRIIDNCKFSTLRAGIRKQDGRCKQYCYLDLSLTFINKEGNNLQNISIDDYVKNIKKIITYIEAKYGIEINKNSLLFQQMEINCNVILSKPFIEYKSLLRIWMYILSSQQYKQYVKEYKGVNKKEYSLDPQTFYRGNDHMAIEIYDKKAELRSKEKFILSEDMEIMRIEIKLKKSQKIREVFHTNNIYHIKMEQIKRYFLNQIESNMVAPFEVLKQTNRSRLMILLQRNKKNTKNWILESFRECVGIEYKNEIPLIIDINDFIEAVNKEDKHNHNKRNEEKIREYCKIYGHLSFDENSKCKEIIEKIRNM